MPAIRTTATVAIESIKAFDRNQGLVVAGYIAYTILFALFPFIIFLLTLGGLIGRGDSARDIIELGFQVLPDQVSDALRPPVADVLAAPRTSLMTISIVITLWVASSGMESLRYAVNLAYHSELPKGYWKGRIQSIAVTVLVAFVTLVLIVNLVAGPFLLMLAEWLAPLPAMTRLVYDAGRHIVGMALLFLVTSALFRWLPNKRLRKREVMPGALFVVIAWTTAAGLFSYYLRSLATYTVTYGSLGGVVITLLFFYISALIFIFGAEINAAIMRVTAPTQSLSAADSPHC